MAAPPIPAIPPIPPLRSSRVRAVAVVITMLSMAGSMTVSMTVAGPVPAAGAQLRQPVEGTVTDPFRPPAHVGAPGNRGWEYATAPGTPVHAVASGVVVFAGPIGASQYVSIDHDGGLRTTYSPMATVDVVAGQRVGVGAVLGTTGAVFHFGARRDATYVDPATLFGAGATTVRLIPRTPASPRPPGSPSADGTWVGAEYTRRLARHWVS